MGHEWHQASRDVHYEKASDDEATESEAKIVFVQTPACKAPKRKPTRKFPRSKSRGSGT